MLIVIMNIMLASLIHLYHNIALITNYTVMQ